MYLLTRRPLDFRRHRRLEGWDRVDREISRGNVVVFFPKKEEFGGVVAGLYMATGIFTLQARAIEGRITLGPPTARDGLRGIIFGLERGLVQNTELSTPALKVFWALLRLARERMVRGGLDYGPELMGYSFRARRSEIMLQAPMDPRTLKAALDELQQKEYLEYRSSRVGYAFHLRLGRGAWRLLEGDGSAGFPFGYRWISRRGAESFYGGDRSSLLHIAYGMGLHRPKVRGKVLKIARFRVLDSSGKLSLTEYKNCPVLKGRNKFRRPRGKVAQTQGAAKRSSRSRIQIQLLASRSLFTLGKVLNSQKRTSFNTDKVLKAFKRFYRMQKWNTPPAPGRGHALGEWNPNAAVVHRMVRVLGMPLRRAAEAAGVPVSTAWRWVKAVDNFLLHGPRRGRGILARWRRFRRRHWESAPAPVRKRILEEAGDLDYYPLSGQARYLANSPP